MNRISKKIYTCIIVFLCFCLLGGVLCINNISSMAEGNLDNSTDINVYVDDDKLFNSKKTIQQFATDVKNMNDTVNVTELKQVIPVEYLRFKEDGYQFQYNGKEYGFFVCHRWAGNNPSFKKKVIDVVIIDFIREQVDTRMGIRAKLILQESFEYTSTNNVDNWNRITHAETYKNNSGYEITEEYRTTYYLARPSFLWDLQNENSLNYGDIGYSKEEDQGRIIYYAKVNYEGVQIINDGVTKEEFVTTMKKMALAVGKKGLDYVAGLIPGGSTILNVVKDIAEIGSLIKDTCEIYEDKIVEVEANNDKNILEKYSKEAQRRQSDLPTYVRTLMIAPQDDILVTDEDNSYIESKILIDEPTERSRITQIFQFRLLRSTYGTNSDLNYIENKNSEGEDIPFSAVYQDTLFSDAEGTVTTLNSDVHTQESLTYLLANGNQKFLYTAPNTTTYQIFSPSKLAEVQVFDGNIPVTIQKINNQLAEMDLQEGKTYTIIFSSLEPLYYNMTFQKKANSIIVPEEDNITLDTRNLSAGESLSFGFHADRSESLSVVADKNKYSIRIYCEDKLPVDPVRTDDYWEFFVEEGNTYYIEFINKTNLPSGETQCSLTHIQKVVVNRTNGPFKVIGQKHFSFYVPVAGKYEITDLSSGLTGRITGNNVQVMEGGYYLEKGNYELEISGNAVNTKCCIQFSSHTLRVSGGESMSFLSEGLTSAFIKFVPKISAIYQISSSEVKFTQLIEKEKITEYSSNVVNTFLEAGQVYYFRVEGKSSKLADIFYIKIEPKTMSQMTVDKNTGIGVQDISGSGEQFISITVTKEGQYAITGVPDYIIFNRDLTEIDSTSTLTPGNYYLKVVLLTGKIYNLQMRVGKPMKVGASIGLTGSRVFKYELEIGTDYTIKIRKGIVATFTTSVVLWDTYGNSYEPIKNGEIYTFTACDSIMYVDLTMINGEGQTGSLVLTKATSTAKVANTAKATNTANVAYTKKVVNSTFTNSGIEKEESLLIEPGEFYALDFWDEGIYITIPKGNYNIIVRQLSLSYLQLYKVSDKELIAMSAELTKDGGAIYDVSGTTSQEYYWWASGASAEVDFVLAPKSDYIIDVDYGTKLEDDKLLVGDNYSFSLFYTLENGEYHKFEGAQNSNFYVEVNTGTNPNIQLSCIDNYYNFYQYAGCSVTVSYHFAGYDFADYSYEIINPIALEEFKIAEKDIEEGEIAEGELYLETSMIYSSNSGFRCIGGNIVVQETKYTFAGSSIYFSLHKYIWEEVLEFEITYNFYTPQLGESSREFHVTSKIEYENPAQKFHTNSSINLSGREFGYIDFTALTTSENSKTKEIVIPLEMKMINFEGKYNNSVEKLDIVIENRSTPLIINMDNFSYKFNNAGLKNLNNSHLYINVEGYCKIIPESQAVGSAIEAKYLHLAGDGELLVKAAQRSKAANNSPGIVGWAGIAATTLNVKISTLEVQGGNGGEAGNSTQRADYDSMAGANGYTGGNGGLAVNVDYLIVTEKCKTLTLIGGNGGAGSNGANGSNGAIGESGGGGGTGGAGGNGGAAYNSARLQISSSTQTSYLQGIGGSNGNGGNGGNGGQGNQRKRAGDGGNGGYGGIGATGRTGNIIQGNGGRGGDGGDGTEGGPGNDGGTGGTGGNGYIGGNGGNGGHGADGSGGRGGNGGAGGEGFSLTVRMGEGGDGGDGGNGSESTNGGRGGDGGRGSYGGDGGDGGKGGDSADAWKSGAGGRGGNGGYGYCEGGVGGKGGDGGRGADGGNGGNGGDGLTGGIGGDGGNGGKGHDDTSVSGGCDHGGNGGNGGRGGKSSSDGKYVQPGDGGNGGKGGHPGSNGKGFNGGNGGKGFNGGRGGDGEDAKAWWTTGGKGGDGGDSYGGEAGAKGIGGAGGRWGDKGADGNPGQKKDDYQTYNPDV